MALPESLIEEDVARRIGELQRVIEAQQQRAHQHLQLAAKVHGSLLPSPVRTDRLDVDVRRYLPVEGVGGDYCQIRFPSEDVCYITVWDVTGHGIGAALLATRVSSEVRHGVLSELLDGLNRFVCDHFADAGLFLTFVAVRIDLARRELTWSGAGHPSPILLSPDGATAALASQNLMIRVQPECLATEPEHRRRLDPGNRVLIYTDGVTEVFDSTGSELGERGLAAIAVSARSGDVFSTTDRILERISAFQAGPAADDRTLILLAVQ